MTGAKQIARAVLTSSVAGLTAYFVLLVLSGDLSASWAPGSFAIAFAVLLVGVLAIGIPVHLVLTRLRARRAWYYVSAGFLIPALLAIAIAPFGGDQLVLQGLVLGGVGACVAWVFFRTVSSSAEKPRN
jgi:hypothetical protein